MDEGYWNTGGNNRFLFAAEAQREEASIAEYPEISQV
jgi:hypothetical protein